MEGARLEANDGDWQTIVPEIGIGNSMGGGGAGAGVGTDGTGSAFAQGVVPTQESLAHSGAGADPLVSAAAQALQSAENSADLSDASALAVPMPNSATAASTASAVHLLGRAGVAAAGTLSWRPNRPILHKGNEGGPRMCGPRPDQIVGPEHCRLLLFSPRLLLIAPNGSLRS